MFNLHLTPEQLEFRDTVRDFVQSEVKPVALHPTRLEPFEKPLLLDTLEYASRMGLRTLAVSEAAGGAGADALTSCIVLEELAAGDVDLAMALGLTLGLARMLEEGMSAPQRERFLTEFVEDHRYHLALVDARARERGWNYHREESDDEAGGLTAVKEGGDWIISGAVAFVPNAPIAKLFVVHARTDAKKTGAAALTAFLVSRNAAGVEVGEPVGAFGAAGLGAERERWHHGTGAEVRFSNCRVSAAEVLGREGQSPAAGAAHETRSEAELAAINLGVGSAAHEAAVDYSKIRIQGGRPIIQHQAIGTILSDCAVKLELARNMIWKAAWVADHPEAVTDRSVCELPLATMARTYTAEAMHEVTVGAAECFGAMGVMRDMPLQKYVHDAMVFLHGADHDSATKLEIAEAIAGYARPLAA